MTEKSFYYRYCIVIPESYSKISNYFTKILEENSFDIQSFTVKNKIYLCLCQKDENKIFLEAQKLKLKKIYPQNTVTDDEFLQKEITNLEQEKYFISSEKENYIPQNIYYTLHSIDLKKDEKLKDRYGLNLFTESEMLYIEKSILENIPISNMEELLQLLSEITPPKSILNLIKKNLNIKEKSPIIDTNSIFSTLINYHIISEHFPLHTGNITEIIKKKIFSFSTPYDLIRAYFNDEIALYFAWAYYYTKYISIPAIISIIIIISEFFITNESLNKVRILYALFIIFWAQFFIVFWKQKNSILKVLWGNDDEEYEKESRRKEFYGEWKISKVTGNYVLNYPFKKRFYYYIISFIALSIFIIISVFLHIIFYNIKGVFPDNDIFVIYSIKRFFQKSVFQNFIVVWLLGFLNDTIHENLGNYFQLINKYTTELENHKTIDNYQNSIIIKKFIFDSVNSFLNLFYLAFFLQNLNEASLSIKTSLYTAEFNRIKDETIMPNLQKLFFTITQVRNVEKVKNIFKINENNLILGKPIEKNEILNQENLCGYDTYGDYSTLIHEFCYLTLFASCVPEIAIILFIANFFELKNDLMKLCSVIKRPEYYKKKGIGAWKYIMEFIAIISVYTNCLFIYLYNNLTVKNNFDLLQFTIMEHFILFVIVLLRVLLPSTSNWVKIYKERKEYKERIKKHLKKLMN